MTRDLKALTEETPTAHALSRLTALSALSSPRFQKLVATGTLLSTGYQWAKRRYELEKAKGQYQILVGGGTEIYRAAEEWLVTQVPSSDQRSLSVSAPYRNGPLERLMEPGGSRRRPARRILVSFDGTIEQEVMIDGHKVKVTAYEEATPSVTVEASSISAYRSNLRTIKFVCSGIEARDAVLTTLQTQLAQMDRAGNRCFVLNQWGDWIRRDFMAARPLSTVFMADGIIEELREDLELFLGAEESYLALGAPWHRGYLFSGPPGTGKTSLAKALGYEYDLDIYMLSLPDLEKDTNLASAFSQVEAPALLVIEDIDVATAATSREEHIATVSLSGLLNALDGIGTPHGLVTIMTSNEPQRLDPALVRAGRVDRTIECDLLDGETFKRLVTTNVGIEPTFTPDRAIAADVMEVIKRHLHDNPEETMYALEREFGNVRTLTDNT